MSVVVITGASGLVGRALVAAHGGDEVRTIGRNATPVGTARSYAWDQCEAAVAGADIIYHLAGATISKRWTEAYKREIYASRVETTQRLVDALARTAPAADTQRVLVSASATGYYGDRGDELLNEVSPSGADFLATVCTAWEAAAQLASDSGVRVVCARFGIILDSHGGALPKLVRVFRLGAGGRLGSGAQWMPWITLSDAAAMVQWAARTDCRGPINVVAPEAVTNAMFTRELGRVLGRRPFLPVPPFALRLAVGEMSEALLASQRVVPAIAQAGGFGYSQPTLGGALASLL